MRPSPFPQVLEKEEMMIPLTVAATTAEDSLLDMVTDDPLHLEPVITRFFAPLRNLLVSWFGEGIVAILTVALGVIVTIAISKVLLIITTRFFRRTFSRSKKITPLMANFIIKVINTVGWVLVGIMCLQQMGINMVPVITGLGVTGVIAGFAFQESLGNLLAGVMIVINEPIRMGDWIQSGSFSGTVIGMDMMCITLFTADKKRITIANKQVWGAPIVNTSYTDIRRVDMSVIVPYGTDLVLLKNTISSILDGYDDILKEPAPAVEITSLDAANITLFARPWVLPENYGKVFQRFQVDIYQKMDELGINLARSYQSVRLVDGSGKTAEPQESDV